jgi:hypothetical protein
MIITMHTELFMKFKVDCSFDEFLLNWCVQVPHWDLLTNEGVNWAKNTEGVKYK